MLIAHVSKHGFQGGKHRTNIVHYAQNIPIEVAQIINEVRCHF